ncbi:uncharacterized protein LOC126844379 [Adelges cooleyi]|uniref:uncharacterized protein LOC126844379 n=1 Tax=Adelges cooleyi TaxID=133065 RepID=UPI00217FB80D|nr:uncharacterized protein LOC126844379 [Adelges cooleyi]
MSTSYNNNYGHQAFSGQSATEAAALSWYDMVVRQQQHDRLVEKLFLHEQQQRMQHRILLRADDEDDNDLNGPTETEQEVPTVDFRQHVWPIIPPRSLDGCYGDDHSRPCSPLDLSVKPNQRAGDATMTTVKATALLQVTVDGQSEFFDNKTAASTPVKRRGQFDSSSEAKSKSKKLKRTNNNNNNNNCNEDDSVRNDDKLLKKVKAASRKLNFSLKTGVLDKSSPVSGTIIVEKPTGPDADYKTERPKNRKRRREDDAGDENQPEERHADPGDRRSRDPVGLDAADDDDDEFGGDIDPRFNVVAATPEARQQLAEIPNVIGEYRCRLCTTVYPDAFALAAHRCKCIVHVRYRCPECSKVFQCPANLASHRRWHGAATGKNAAEANRHREEQRPESTPPPSQPSPSLSVDSPLGYADAATTSGTVFFKKNMLQRAAVEANNNNNNAFKADNNVVM